MAIDVGDGSDGICDEVTITATPKNYYQCTSLNINGAITVFKAGQAGAGVGPVVIKVQGDATIGAGGSIDFSGANGAFGNNTVRPGGAAGAGGGAGGSSQIGAAGLSGNGPGAGIFGQYVADDPAGTSSYGGGGGGGSYKTKSATVPNDGFDSNGGGAGSAGTNGPIFVTSESQFDSNFSGGSGGGAGGGGTINGSAVSGSSGGGGAGAIRIISGGNIVVAGQIIFNGGAGGGIGSSGGSPTQSSGAGGGASGGAVWLQAVGSLKIENTGSISALGGLGGKNDFDLIGGNGGNGGIRLDDADGVIENLGVGNILPSDYYHTTFGSTATSRLYTSSVACGRVALEDQKPFNNLINLILGMMITSLIYLSVYFSRSRKGKV